MIGVNTNYVLDTNSLIMSLSSRNKYSYIWDAFVTGRYTLCVTNEILTEYEEVISTALELNRIGRVEIYYLFDCSSLQKQYVVQIISFNKS